MVTLPTYTDVESPAVRVNREAERRGLENRRKANKVEQ